MNVAPAILGTSLETIAKMALKSDQPGVLVLTAQMSRGDEAAFREFHRLYFDRLLRYLFVVTKGREEIAHEALQMTYVRVARHVRKFDSETAFWNWLAMLARNCAVDEIRKQNRHVHLLARFLLQRPPDVAGECIVADRYFSELLQEGLANLPDNERTLLERKYFDGASLCELADQCQMSEKAMESHLLRIRRKLKAIVFRKMQNETN